MPHFHCFSPRVIQFTLLAVLLPLLTSAQSPDSLSKYFTSVSLEDPDSAWHVLKPELKGKKLFLFGEVHGVAVNNILQLSLLKYLHKYANVRHLLLEVSPAEGFLYDHYLRTGEKKYLTTTTYSDILEDRRFWDSLYLFNKQQPSSQKIRVFGIDKADHLNFVQAMKVIFWESKANDSLPYEFERVNNQLIHCVTKLKGFKKLRRLLKEDFVKQPNVYKDYLGDDFWYFRYTISNTLYRYSDRKRDLKMYQNTLIIFDEFEQDNFLGVFGESHVNTFQKNNYSLYYYLNDNETIQDSIFTLHTHYKEVEALYLGKVNRFRESGLFLQKQKHFIVPNAFKTVFEQVESDITLMPLRLLIQASYFGLHRKDFFLYIKNQKAETLVPLVKRKK